MRDVPPLSHPAETEVALIGMEFHVCVGILPHERELPQPLEIDLVVRHDAPEALDYRDLYALTRDTVERDERTFLEPIAETIAARALSLARVHWCRVVIRKPNVALGGPLAHARITVERSRG
jgi:7,8-dihydroneopterin aldolase/epimerase/oxygenase